MMKKKYKWLFILVIALGLTGNMSCDSDSGNEEVETKTNSICPDNHHPHAIDLGLPSGTLWACSNIGAKAPENKGSYYAWGDTKAKTNFTKSNYLNGKGYSNIGNEISGSTYDIATNAWGSSWVMPTATQLNELRTKCSHVWTDYKGVHGVILKGRNGNSIFLPAAGVYYNDEFKWEGDLLYIWSSTSFNDHNANAMAFIEEREQNFVGGCDKANWGYSVRAVKHP